MRVRLRYTEVGKVRFLSHRDLARVWERAIRKAGLPVAYSEGFSPRPKLHFGLALSVGHESLAEFLDIDLRDEVPVDVDDLPGRLTACLPDGVEVVAAHRVADNEPALQAVVTSCTWSFVVEGGRDEVASAVDALLRRDEVPLVVERKGKPQPIDLRPQLLAAEVLGEGRGAQEVVETTELRVELSTVGRSIRPAELLAAFEPPLRAVRVRRLEQWMDVDGVSRPPVPADPSHSPVAIATG